MNIISIPSKTKTMRDSSKRYLWKQQGKWCHLILSRCETLAPPLTSPLCFGRTWVGTPVLMAGYAHQSCHFLKFHLFGWGGHGCQRTHIENIAGQSARTPRTDGWLYLINHVIKVLDFSDFFSTLRELRMLSTVTLNERFIMNVISSDRSSYIVIVC